MFKSYKVNQQKLEEMRAEEETRLWHITEEPTWSDGISIKYLWHRHLAKTTFGLYNGTRTKSGAINPTRWDEKAQNWKCNKCRKFAPEGIRITAKLTGVYRSPVIVRPEPVYDKSWKDEF